MPGGSGRRALPLALTMGDPAGISLEITLMAWRERLDRALPPFVLYADPDAVAARARTVGISVPVEVVTEPDAGARVFAERLPVRPVRLAAAAHHGRPNAENAAAVVASIEDAVAAVVAGEAAALVTNPIAKSVLYEKGFDHPGHTEFLGHLARERCAGAAVRPVMMLVCDELRVVPLTVHIPLAKVPRAVTRPAIEETVRITARALKRDFGISRPRIAVAGLNPHAGESGALGREDVEIIAPAVEGLRAAGLLVTGPHAADTLFHAAARKTYDAVLAMYHDQALIPLKTLAFETGVNVTLGLPFVRTSPDHGTAFGIAGTGRASPESLIASLELADTLAARRAAYREGAVS